jgi:hypothetical protein
MSNKTKWEEIRKEWIDQTVQREFEKVMNEGCIQEVIRNRLSRLNTTYLKKGVRESDETNTPILNFSAWVDWKTINKLKRR